MPKKKTQNEIINEFKSIHGDRYDYSEVYYVNSKTKVIVICSVHGKFEITPNHHLKGVGCKDCHFDSQKISKQEFVNRSNKYWGYIYDYSLFEKMPSKGKKVQIKCLLHNVIFSQEPRNHMRGHTGCPKCKSAKLSGNRNNRGTIKTQADLTKEFISRAKKIHGNAYDYSKFKYTNASRDGIIICPKHGSFSQSPSNHLKGTKCPACANQAFTKGTFREKCIEKGTDYYRALKRRQAGHTEEKIFEKGYIGNTRTTKPILVYGNTYPNLMEAIRALKEKVKASPKTIARRIKMGFSTEEAFSLIPNPGYKNGIIYLISHIDSERKYVGLTIQTLEKRWAQHKEDALYYYIKSDESLHAAIREFGPESFNIKILDRGTTKIDLEEKEKKWIKKLGTLVPNGFNISKGGGSGGSNPIPTPIDGILFPSKHEAAEYLAKKKNISTVAAKWRIRFNKHDIKSPAKPGESLVKTQAYKSWSRIKNSVLNPKSKDYIAGITLYKPWEQFDKFLKDNGQPPEQNMAFTRLDKEKGYYPDNCAWLTKSESSKINAAQMKKTGRLTGNKKKTKR